MANLGEELSCVNFESLLGGPLVAIIKAQAQASLGAIDFIKSVGFKNGAGNDPQNLNAGEPIYVSFTYPKEIAPYQPASGGAVTGLRIASQGQIDAEPLTVKIDGAEGAGAQARAYLVNGALNLELLQGGQGYTNPPQVLVLDKEGHDTGARVEAVISPCTGSQAPAVNMMRLDIPLLTMMPLPFIRIEETTLDFKAKINSMEYEKIDSHPQVDGSVNAAAGWGFCSAKLKASASLQSTSSKGKNSERSYSMHIQMKAVQDEMPPGMERMLGVLEQTSKVFPAPSK